MKRVFQQGVVLVGTQPTAPALAIVDAALAHFPFGNRGDDGAHAVYSVTLLDALLSAPVVAPRME